MRNEDKKLELLIKSIEEDVKPDEILKEKLLAELMKEPELEYSPSSFWGRLFFSSPWKVTAPLSLIISILMRLQMGSDFNKMVSILFGI